MCNPLKSLLHGKNKAFRDGDFVELRSLQKEIKREVRAGKMKYKRTIEAKQSGLCLGCYEKHHRVDSRIVISNWLRAWMSFMSDLTYMTSVLRLEAPRPKPAL